MKGEVFQEHLAPGRVSFLQSARRPEVRVFGSSRVRWQVPWIVDNPKNLLVFSGVQR